MKTVIVIPTYNERENIQKLIPAVEDVLTEVPEKHEVSILVVDGNSPDGTGEVVEQFSEEYPNVHLLLENEKNGLGAAYVYGFKYAMNEMDADVIIEMDADFQHDPADLPRFIKAIEEGADYVIGSRFVKGGSIPKDWAFYRKFLSWGGSLFSKVVLGIFSVNDFTTGYKASRVKGFVDKMDLDAILSQGFAYKIDLLHRMHRLGSKIKEIPIDFALREEGDSKMEGNNMLDSLRVVLTLRLRELQRFLKFIVVGFIGLFTDLGLFNLLILLTTLPEKYSSGASGFIAMNVTFLLNNFWSFGDSKVTKVSNILKKVPLYYLISYAPIIFRSWLINFSLQNIADNWLVANLAFFMGITIGLIWNFTFYSKIIWQKND
ncbi:glycosyltransferase [candidate division WWE3 bacterium]|nr:glycosyltransferase [candidate division WWE3 bacterium]